jgi:pyrroloquinoline quinone biosynthesis protein D
MFINDTGKAILELCDGSRTLAQISAELSTRYASDVTVDVMEYLSTMFDRDLVTVADH